MTRPEGRPLRLTVVIGSLERGGAEQHLLQVLPLLARRGFSVEVFCLNYRGQLAAEMERRGVPVFSPRARRSQYRLVRWIGQLLGFLCLMLRLLLRRPDIVHFYLPSAYMVGTPAAILACCRVRVMSRRSQNYYQSRYFWAAAVERWLHRRTSAIIGNSRSVTRQLSEEGVPDSRLHLIYNGVDISAYAGPVDMAAIRRELGIAEDALVFVIVANLIPYKGHADLLDALAQAALAPGWVLLCAGRDDGIGQSLQARAEAAGLSGHIRWLGSVEAVPALLAAADIGLLVSHEEGFSNAIIEYMAAGLPVIATDVGGNAEAVANEESGLIVPARDPAALAAAIRRLAADPELRRRMGEAGQRIVGDRYSLEACAEAYDRFYRGLLTRKR